jgi:hypothetical protein
MTFSLKTLLAITALLAFVANVFWKWGPLSASVVLLIVMGVVLYWEARWRQLFTTPDGAIWWGGLLMWFSAFPPYAYGPMGGTVKQIDLLRNIDLSWIGIGWLLNLSGMCLGAVLAALAFVAIVVDPNRFISQLRFISVAIILCAIATGNIIVPLVL